MTHIGLMDSCRTAQVAFIFGGLLGQNVTFEGLAAFNGSTGTDAEAFLRRALGLHFGHLHAPSSIVLVRRTENFSVLVGPEPLIGNRLTAHCCTAFLLTRCEGRALSQTLANCFGFDCFGFNSIANE